ncbi:kinase-like domain-containing protein [Lasiosphaeria miniovina]|uniref:EKC/KEOPS complex subunit BUD32 n=1 Tax=Lasiosphaeria miniovina TaxID=1954250 RepID=A0AA40B3V4_9PEZI|nr:kinase-like domain-containing protein [Lasiosphaeria miniovina]KAK0727167.1 kinase-like domain-containing protein [Lasiosphaeria miniovina]
MANKSQVDDPFSKEVLRFRAEYEHRRVTTNLYPPGGRPHLEMELQRSDKSYMTYWFNDGTKYGQCVRIFDVPGHFEIDGDDIRPLNCCLEHPELIEDDFEDVSELVTKLPLVRVDPAKHFVKKGKYRSEIENLIKCQGGSVPGHPLSPNIIQLLGRSADGQLVFEKLSSSARTLGRFYSLAVYRSWILQLIDALDCLHSVGIVHRDLRADNLLFSDDGGRLVVCDLESRWGERSAPEVAFQGGLEDSGWTARSDIYDIRNCIKSMVYWNGPITHFVEWPVPPPLQAIVEACMRLTPEERPTLADLRIMVGEIQKEIDPPNSSSHYQNAPAVTVSACVITCVALHMTGK